MSTSSQKWTGPKCQQLPDDAPFVPAFDFAFDDNVKIKREDFELMSEEIPASHRSDWRYQPRTLFGLMQDDGIIEAKVVTHTMTNA